MNFYSYSAFSKIIKELKEKIVGCRINNITVINSHDFLCTLSMIKDEKLLISLNHQHPFLGMVNISKVEPTITGNLNECLRKHLKDAYIVDISLDNNDRVIHFVIQKANDYYEKVVTHLYLECIPQRANLLFVNEDNKIIHALHYSSVTSSRAILNGLSYEYPQRGELKEEDEIPSLKDIKAKAIEYYENALLVHKKEKFTPLYRYIKSRIKSLGKKVIVLDKEIETAKIHLNDVEVGNMLLALQYDKEQLDEHLKDNNISLDPSKSVIENANALFKKYKKSKRTIEMATIEVEKANKEIEYLTYLLSSSQFMNDEELFTLSQELLPKQHLKKKLLPIRCSYIIYDNVKISFGKNASSNNELTFKIANKDDTYLHIKDYHGAHVIIHDTNPSNEVKLVAAELCLLLSNKSAGDIMITNMKNVKKGHALGEANLLNYSIITLTKVREETISLINNKKDY